MHRTLIAFVPILLIALGASAQDGTFDPSFNPTDQGMARFDGLHRSHQQGIYPSEGVRTLTVQPDGKLLVGGWFPGGVISIEDPVFRPGIARLNTDGTQDVSFDAGIGFDGPIEIIVVQPDGKILVGGGFLNFNGSSRKGIARLNSNGSLDAGFTVGTGTGGTVFEIAVQADGRILLGGNFTTFNALSTSRIVRLLDNGSFDPSFVTGTGFNGTVNALAVQVDGKVLAGGAFTSYQGLLRNYLVRLNTNGSLDAPYADPAMMVAPSGPVYDIANGTLGSSYVTIFNMTACQKRLGSGALDPAFTYNVAGGSQSRIAYDQAINMVTVFGDLYIEKANGTTGAAVYGSGNYRPDWYYRTSCNHLIVDWRNSAVGPSGEVFRIDAVHTGILRLNNDLSLDPGFTPGTGLAWIPNATLGMTMDGSGRILFGGRIDFKTTMPAYNGHYQPDLCRLGFDGEIDPSFSFPHGFEGAVRHVRALGADRTLFYGNVTLTCAPGAYAGYVSTTMLIHDGTTDVFTPLHVPGCVWPTPYGPEFWEGIGLTSGSILYAGNDNCSGASRDVGRFLSSGTWDGAYATTDLGPGNVEVRSMVEAPDGKVYIGGNFTSANGITRNRIVRLLANGGVDPGFDPLTGFDGEVRDMIVNPDGTIVCIGSFTSYRGSPAPHIAKLLPSGSMDPVFDPGSGIANTPMCVLRYPDGRILIGGAIPMYDGTVVNGIVCINADGSIDEGFEQGEGFRINNPTINGGTPGGGTVVAMEMQPNGQVVCMGEFHMYDGNGRNRLARIGSGTSLMVSARVFLEGPYNGLDAMAALIPRALLPLAEPYRALGFTHVGGGSESTSAAVMQMQGPGAIIDWVLVELRDPLDPTQIVATRSGLLRADGWIVDTDGVSPLRFYGLFMGQYHVAVRHRNHLGIMSEAPIFLGSAPFPIDFTGPTYSTYGSNGHKEVNGVRMLWAGDVNHDGQLKYVGGGANFNDRDPILQAIGGSVPTQTISGQYRGEDVNMDGAVKYVGDGNDRDPILVNIGGSAPTNTRQAQLP